MTGIYGVNALASSAAFAAGSPATSTTSTTSATSATGTATTGTSSTGSTAGQLGKDTFLKLLVAQLKYQDPESPTDATQFLSQTAQFTLVEKIDALSTLDQKVLDTTKAQAAMSLVGRKVTWSDLSGVTHTGTVTAASLGSQSPSLTVDGTTVSYDDLTGTVA